MAQYYAQRASAGLIISEAIGISQQGLGWPFATGLWSDEQIAGWLRVTVAVHAAGGRIIAQLRHRGRTVHPSFNGGVQLVSASGTTAPGRVYTHNGKQQYLAGRPIAPTKCPRSSTRVDSKYLIYWRIFLGPELKAPPSLEHPNPENAREPRSPLRASVLERSNGRCEYCDVPGFRTIGGRLYLETHHVIPLFESGEDRVWNVAALCPNHHREAHSGEQAQQITAALLELLNEAFPNASRT